MKYKLITVFNIPYIKARVPIKSSPQGDYIDCNYKKVEESVLKTIIAHHIPLTGLEVKFIRHFFSLNMNDFGKIFGVSNAAVCKWEKKKNMLDLTTQMAIRAYVVEQLGLPSIMFSELSKTSKPKPLVVKMAA